MRLVFVATLVAVFALGAVSGAGGLWFYQERRNEAAQQAEAQQMLDETSAIAAQEEARFAALLANCPTVIQEADREASVEALDLPSFANTSATVSRGYDQRGYAAEIGGAMLVAGELTIRVPGERGYTQPLRYIKRRYGTIDVLYGRRMDDARFSDDWRAIVGSALCVVYE